MQLSKWQAQFKFYCNANLGAAARDYHNLAAMRHIPHSTVEPQKTVMGDKSGVRLSAYEA